MAEEPVDKAAPAYMAMPGIPNMPGAKVSPFNEVGVSGLKAYSGYVQEEYLSELRGPAGIKVYRTMSEGDPIVRAVLMAIELILRAVDWRVEPANDSPEAEKEAEFVDGLFTDTAHTFEDFIAEALSMLTFGWSYFEEVYKRRNGPDQTNPSQRSKFTDGRIGLRKLAIRSQDTLLRWEIADNGEYSGLWQIPPLGGGLLFVPLSKALLFRTTSKKDNPEGFSILRAAYRPWYLLKTVEDMEAIGIERELAGLPVVSIPAKYLLPNASAADQSVSQAYQKIARDIKFNQQGGVVIPSDRWVDPTTGAPTAYPLVELKLLTTGGRRAIDTDPVVQRHQRNIARSALADFIMLGDTKGSYALSKNKSELFLRACETYLNQIASPLNRFLIPRVWGLNGLDGKLMPELKPGRVAPVDLAEIGTYIQQLAGSGAPLFPDEDLESYLRDVAGLPEAAPDVTTGAGTGPGDAGAGDDDTAGADDDTLDPADLGAEGFMEATGMPRSQKSAPKTLYVSRPVLNGDDIRQWAAGQGFKSALPSHDMHVTVAFSRKPVDWSKVKPDGSHVVINGGKRSIKALGEKKDAIVLGASSPELSTRHQQLRRAGASWDWPSYQPHVTLTYAGKADGVSPYTGPIVLGPEKFAEVNEGWQDGVTEKPLP